MLRASLLVGLALVALAVANHPNEENDQPSSSSLNMAQSRQLNGVPPAFPVADQLDLSYRLMENMDVHGNQLTSLLSFKFARVLGFMQHLEEDIHEVQEKLMDIPQLNLEENFDMLKEEIADVEKFVKGAIKASTEEIINEVDIKAEAIVGKVADSEHTVSKSIQDSQEVLAKEVAHAEKFIKGAVEASTQEVVDKVDVIGEALAGKVLDAENTLLHKVEDTAAMNMEKLMAVEDQLESDIEESTNKIKKAVIYVGKKVAEGVHETEQELSTELQQSTSGIVQEVKDSKKYLYAAISATGVYLEKSIDKSTETIVDKIMDNAGGGGGGASVTAIADAVDENTESSLAKLEHDLKKFIHERLSPISQGVKYLTERAYANSVGIRYLKKVLKQMASHGCYGKSGNIELNDEDDLDDHPEELKLRVF